MPPARSVLLLDVMETLVHEPFYREIPAFFGMELAELIEAKHPTAWAEFERGEIDEAELEARFFLDRRRYDHAGLVRATEAAYRWIDGMEPLLAELHAAGHEMHALSNYPDWWRRIDAKLGLSRYLAWTFVSCRTGWRKPHPRAYRHALESLDVPAERCLFVDDREENCAAARAEGIDAIRFRGADALRAELAARGLLPG